LIGEFYRLASSCNVDVAGKLCLYIQKFTW
jgi:hypothetical protein